MNISKKKCWEETPQNIYSACAWMDTSWIFFISKYFAILVYHLWSEEIRQNGRKKERNTEVIEYYKQIDLATCLQQWHSLGDSSGTVQWLQRSFAGPGLKLVMLPLLPFFSGSSLNLHLFPSQKCSTCLPTYWLNIVINVMEGDTQQPLRN